MSSIIRYLPLLAAVCLLSQESRADLVWFANFESYDTKNGPAPLRIDQTGASDTFSGVTASPASLATTTNEVVSSPSGGNALSLSVTSQSQGSPTMRVIQSALSQVPEKGALIISFDATNIESIGLSIPAEARSSNKRSGKTVYFPLSATANAAIRIFIVINQSGEAITLPGELGSLQDKSMACYSYDSISYSKQAFLSEGDVLTLPIRGFLTGIGKNNFPSGKTIAAHFDNFGVWTSATDKVKDVSVLSLLPGTVTGTP